jgi:hypothetical protein
MGYLVYWFTTLLVGTGLQARPDDIARVPAPRPLERGCVTASILELDAASFTVQKPGEAPVRFGLSRTLAAGKASDNREAHGVHRFADLQVGDLVAVEYRFARGGPKICVELKIRKRPGGLIPPAQDDPRAKHRYHEYMNAYWDNKDRGIPMPEKFVMRMPKEDPLEQAPPPRLKK